MEDKRYEHKKEVVAITKESPGVTGTVGTRVKGTGNVLNAQGREGG